MKTAITYSIGLFQPFARILWPGCRPKLLDSSLPENSSVTKCEESLQNPAMFRSHPDSQLAAKGILPFPDVHGWAGIPKCVWPQGHAQQLDIHSWVRDNAIVRWNKHRRNTSEARNHKGRSHCISRKLLQRARTEIRGGNVMRVSNFHWLMRSVAVTRNKFAGIYTRSSSRGYAVFFRDAETLQQNNRVAVLSSLLSPEDFQNGYLVAKVNWNK